MKIHTAIGRLIINVNDTNKISSVTFDNENRAHNGNSVIRDKALKQMIQQQFSEYFAGDRKQFVLPIEYDGTHFEKQVWSRLLSIGYGTTLTYRELAVAIGNPKAVRAAAHAVAQNPLPILVPCHRIVRSDGTIGEYALHTLGSSGKKIKRFLLNLESSSNETIR